MRNTLRLTILGILITLASQVLLAQTTTATLSGVVRDTQGAVIPNATVTAMQVATGQSRQVATNSEGIYTIPNLPIGDYRVSVSSEGFKVTTIPSLTLQVNQVAQIDVVMQIGAVTEEINVNATAPLLATETSSVGQVVENRSIASLALNGRQFWQLVALVPGASYTPGGDRTRTGGGSIRSSAGERPDQRHGFHLQRLAAGRRRHHGIRTGWHQYSAQCRRAGGIQGRIGEYARRIWPHAQRREAPP